MPLRDLCPHPRGDPRSRQGPRLGARDEHNRKPQPPSFPAGQRRPHARFLPACPRRRAAAGPGKAGEGAIGPIHFEPNAFLRIGTDNSVTVISKHLEMGQGTYTGLATILADELDADWKTVRIEGAPADAKRYNNLFWGPAQGTGGSTAMANSWEQMRRAGAAGRAMLVSAAAKQMARARRRDRGARWRGQPCEVKAPRHVRRTRRGCGERCPCPRT